MLQIAENGIDDKRPLYDPKILQELNFEENVCADYDPKISPQSPGESLLMRPLCREDYDKGYISLLSQLTTVGDISREEFELYVCYQTDKVFVSPVMKVAEGRYSRMESCLDSYFITVIEDLTTKKIIASGTLVKEQKFIHKCSARGRVEDIVVNSDYRGKQLGKLLVDVLTMMSKKVGCYKVSLECLDKVLPFYSKFGYVKEDGQNYMCRRFKD